MLKKIIVGISTEAQNDIDSAKIIIKNLLKEIGYEPSFAKELKSNTGIFKNVTAHTRLFFESKNAVDFAFFITDMDTKSGEESKKRYEKIVELIKSVNPNFLEKSIIAVPNPHLEAWLMADDNLVKRIFGLDGAKPIPGKRLKPKTRLIQLHQNSKIAIGTEHKVRCLLSESLNLKTVEKKCKCFKRFVAETKKKLSNS